MDDKLIKDFSINILYAEDEDKIRESVVNVLDIFFTCTHTCNGLEAYELYISNPFKYDLIITDINMPILDGLELCEKIREKDKDIPIIITTAYSDNDYLFEAIKLGVSQYVVKPLDIYYLLKTINTTIEPILLKQEKEKKEKEYQKKLIEQAKYAAIGELAAGITHEINTPLTFMKSSFELIEIDINDLENSNIKTSIQEDLTNIKNGFQRLESIIISMKEIIGCNKKIRKKTNIFETLLVSLNIAYNKSKHISNININNKPFDFNTKKIEEEFITYVNPSRIEQVWIIIINNALDELIKIENFDDRKLNIHIYKDIDEITVRFCDNAGGINEKILNKIFEPFKSTKDSSGMGIGLSIAKKIILAHHGKIKAYNEHQGAVFEIKLPILENQE